MYTTLIRLINKTLPTNNMCGIIGIFNDKNATIKIVKGLKKIKNRGQDGFGISTIDSLKTGKTMPKLPAKKQKDVFGHTLHSIVSKVPQPFSDKDASLIANCEIYNWEELTAKHNITNAKNDAELIFKLLKTKKISVIDELDGDYSFAFWNKSKKTITIARDLIGVKPLWYCHSDSFAFASEKKALIEMGFSNPIELNPRQIMTYNIKTNKIEFTKREFYRIEPEHKESAEKIKEKIFGLMTNAVAKRIPEKKLGLLFSGGVDSTLIAMILKQLGADFTCYISAVEDDEMKSEDLKYSIIAAKQLGLKLKIVKVKPTQVQKYLKKVIPLIEDTNVTKAGVALPFYIACEAARKDGVKVIMSGLGSEELFAGYSRHSFGRLINSECIAGLQKSYEKDLYRDDVVTMDNNIELRVPFFDKALIDYAVKIPGELKIKDGFTKHIMRATCEKYGMPHEFAWRKKRAAQYGSRFDKVLERLARKSKARYKSHYIAQFYEHPNLRLGVLFSGGKDSVYAMHVMARQNYEISCLISVQSENKDSFMFHTPNIDMTKMQAQALGIPLLTHKTKGDKEKELDDLYDAIKDAVKKHKIEGIITGALFSDYQRERIEKIVEELGLKMFSPLWHMPQEEEMMHLAEIFEITFSSVAALGLNKKWLGKRITKEDVHNLIALNKKHGLNVAGEGGEFESLVLDAPMFKKKIVIEEFKIIEAGENTARMDVLSAKLVQKNSKEQD